MAFPTTGVLDNFNRANADPIDGNWTGAIADFPLKVVSNQVAGSDATDGGNGNYTTSFGPNSECFITVPTIPVAGVVSLFVRWDTFSGYAVVADTSTDELLFQRYDAGSDTQLGAAVSQVFSAGDSLGVSVIGNTIELWYKSGAGAWTSKGTRTDSTYTSAGLLGLLFSDGTARGEDFGGGNFVPSGKMLNSVQIGTQVGTSPINGPILGLRPIGR